MLPPLAIWPTRRFPRQKFLEAEATGKSRAAPDPENDDQKVGVASFTVSGSARGVRSGDMTIVGDRRNGSWPAGSHASRI
jgi:hypothetical protein